AGLRAIAHALPACHAAGGDRAARTMMLEGAYLAGTALANVKMGLHHGICHVLGGATGAAHGDLNAVMLPQVMRFNLAAAAPQLALAAAALGVATPGMDERAAAAAGADVVAGWVAAMGLPTRLRDLGVGEEQLPALAALGYVNSTVRSNPRLIGDPGEIEALLRAAW
ncbi:MAG TPA: iron-containing alcohol dehydrogenase, partial [Ktedonobacterales bacterium]|nr:iron-containing alcohol dehydrogenase [Ktedonobacterales bacterium]